MLLKISAVVGAIALALGSAMWMIVHSAPPQAVRLKDEPAARDRNTRSRPDAPPPDFSRIAVASIPWINTLRPPHAATLKVAGVPWERHPASPSLATVAVAQSPWMNQVFAADVPLAESPWARADLSLTGVTPSESPWTRSEGPSAQGTTASLPWRPAP